MENMKILRFNKRFPRGSKEAGLTQKGLGDSQQLPPPSGRGLQPGGVWPPLEGEGAPITEWSISHRLESVLSSVSFSS